MQIKIVKKIPEIFILSILFYLSAPFVEAFLLYKNLQSGIYHSESDSIGLGLFFFVVPWLLFLPFYFGFIFWALWKTPERISLFGFNNERVLWSWIWSIPFGIIFFLFLFSGLQNLFNLHFIEASQEFLAAYLILVFRSIVVLRKR